ncbi:hypothetical protein EB796_003364 [Bugula neritina]|uniref:Uncharacterized protein n=1 Tax=Bugula neritina TaxID=10212 RepID=A0A7J7KJC1_BUGNE|nr:hypothetical protein EB796_003364 [Bugula neritina]
MTIDDSKLNELARQLRRIEKNYLSSELTPTQKAKPGLVSYIKEKLIQPALQDYYADFAYMGSAYEFTSVPGSSDFDIQVFLKVPSTRQNRVKVSSATAIASGDPDWMRVRGGPENLLNDEGYFCPIKVQPSNTMNYI